MLQPNQSVPAAREVPAASQCSTEVEATRSDNGEAAEGPSTSQHTHSRTEAGRADIVSGEEDVSKSGVNREDAAKLRAEVAGLRQEKASLEEAVQQLKCEVGELEKRKEAHLKWQSKHQRCTCHNSAETTFAANGHVNSEQGHTESAHGSQKTEAHNVTSKSKSTPSAESERPPSAGSPEEQVGSQYLHTTPLNSPSAVIYSLANAPCDRCIKQPLFL